MALVTRGLLNKQVAGDLGLSEVTVKVHRGSAMRKMGAPTLRRPGPHGGHGRRPGGPVRSLKLSASSTRRPARVSVEAVLRSAG